MGDKTNDVSVETLRGWLEEGKPVSVVDIRRAAERAEWYIPQSVHVDAYDALWSGRLEVLDALRDLPRDRPVVAVCNAGKTSRIAAQALQARGFDAHSLVGGMKAWSLAWNAAAVGLAGAPETMILQFRRTGKGCLSYLAASRDEAVVIDASLDPEVYLAAARDRGLRITRVFDTHVHADHLSRSRAIAERAGAAVHFPATDRIHYPHEPLRDGDRVAFGDAALTVLTTPGHTPESISLQLDTRALFSGDTLFVDGIGRPDLVTSREGARDRARALHGSLARIGALPGSLLVLPCHAALPVAFDGKPVAATVAAIRDAVASLALPEAEFVESILGRIPPTPPNHLAIVRVNEGGVSPFADPTDVEAGANRCAIS